MKRKTTDRSERLSVLTDAELEAIYGRPYFDEEQQLEYLALTDAELNIVNSRQNIQSRVYCFLQMGYFKAKHAFFKFGWKDVLDDCDFILSRYFPHEKSSFDKKLITKHELYSQRHQIIQLFDYTSWSTSYLASLKQQAEQIVRRDVTPGFVATELLVLLNEQKIVRPGYTTLQELISTALSSERKRLGKLLDEVLNNSHISLIDQLLKRDDTLSQLAVLRQDASSFGWRQMAREREKRATLASLYQVAKILLPKLKVSHQNLMYYANLVNFYTVYDLRHLKVEQTRLYLICYAWVRYRQFTDNLVEAMTYHMKKLGDESRAVAKQLVIDEKVKRHQETSQVGQLLSLYLDDSVADFTPFGEVRQQAYQIMPKALLQSTVQHMSIKPLSKLALRWQAIDTLAGRIRRHLRPLFVILEFGCTVANNPWFTALAWVKGVYGKRQRLSQRPLRECPTNIIPKHLRPYLLIFDEEGSPVSLHADRYEFWLYHQIRKRFQSGEFYFDDSLQHRCLSDDLVSINREKDVLAQMKIPFLEQPIETQLDALESELHKQWQAFDRELKQGKLTHLEYDKETRKLTWLKPRQKNRKDDEKSFYGKLPFCDVADVLRFVNDQCQFLSALTPLQPRYAKKNPNINSLLAVIIAQAMNHGNHVLARTSDITYHVLDHNYEQYLRHATLQHANDCISDAIGLLPIFPHYSLDLSALYGAVDGQKLGVNHPTLKARHSRKHFGRGKGVAAYSLLCNHIPLNGYIISNHDYEAHHVFDIWYRNTSKIVPTVITGDMHSINKVNFAILHWFGLRFEPRFTNLDKELKGLYCSADPALYAKNWICPVGKIDRQLIISEKDNLNRIVATLGLKEMTQGTLIRKLCTYSPQNSTRRAVFEYDRLIRSIYTLRYLRDPKIGRKVHRSQNRIESYHQLRSSVAQVGGKKELIGTTDVELEISNQCGRLISNAIIYYNSAILSRLLKRYEESNNNKAIKIITSISPVAWRHILLNGHYTFQSNGEVIDIEKLLADLELM